VPRGAAPARAARRPEPRPEERLGLLEFLLACEDPVEMAERCLEWLGEHAGVREGHCLVVEAEQTRLVHLASRGGPRGALNGFAVDLEGREHPLAAGAVRGGTGRADQERTELPFGRTCPFLAVPLRGVEGEECPEGLLRFDR
jgi:hypothetical protein